MKRQCIADVRVPVIPVVPAGELAVLVGHVHLPERAVKRAVVVDEEVLGPAVNQQLRKWAARNGAAGQGEQVVLAPLRVLAENPLELPG